MHFSRQIAALFLTTLIVLPCSATTRIASGQGVSSSGLTETLNHIIAQAPTDVDIGVAVEDLTTGRLLYTDHPHRNFVPASTMKVFTAISALSELGPNYRYETSFLTNINRLDQGQLPGDLYLHFSGDPSLTTQDFTSLVAQLKRAGITGIQGHVYVDAQTFGGPGFGPGWMWDDTILCYSAPVSAATINHNCFQWETLPGGAINSTAHIGELNRTPYATLSNNAVIRAAYDPNCPLTLIGNMDNHYTLSGCLPAKAGPLSLDVAVQNPPLAATVRLAHALTEQGIRFNGPVQLHSTNTTLYHIATHQSPPLNDLLRHMLKVSDNLYANTIFKTLGHAYFHTQGTWHNGSQAVRQILMRDHVNLAHAAIVDGSGLSRYDLVTPMQLVEALNYAYHNFPAEYNFMNALPISGIDGTLKYRLGTKNTLARIHAKTGTLDDMTNLAGYIKTANGHILAFAVLINNTPRPIMPYEIITNRICTYLAMSSI